MIDLPLSRAEQGLAVRHQMGRVVQTVSRFSDMVGPGSPRLSTCKLSQGSARLPDGFLAVENMKYISCFAVKYVSLAWQS
jgi:hypothetical protein